MIPSSSLILCLLLLVDPSSTLSCFVGKEAYVSKEQSKYGPFPKLTPCGSDAKCCRTIPKDTLGHIAFSCSAVCTDLGAVAHTMDSVMQAFKEPDPSTTYFNGFYCREANYYRCVFPYTPFDPNLLLQRRRPSQGKG